MIAFVINECYKIGNLQFDIDGYANIFITKNTTNPEYFPCVVAHMDCILDCANKEVVIKDNKITGRDRLKGTQVGLGADDAVGICVALQLLKVMPDLKVCFTTEEEVGFKGADIAADNVDFFYDVSYLIQADRRNNSDLITFTNGIYSASETWLEQVTGIMAKFNYKEATGIGTDVGVLAERLQLSGVNVSCGYAKEHTNNEYIIIPDAQRCLNFIKSILETVILDRQYEIKVNYTNYYRYYNPNKKDYTWNDQYNYDLDEIDKDYPGYDDFLMCNNCKDFDCMNCKYYNS